MKQICILFVVLFSTNLLAANKSWDNLVVGESYTIDRNIDLERNKLNLLIPVNAKIAMIEKMPLPMIKVDLYKFSLGKYCSDNDFTSEINLIDINQPNGKLTTIGVDIAEDCILEVFVETKDTYSLSLFH